ncbi:methyltransferase domain-containing protein [Solirubrobacter sp. CPCC 204708]|uniref:Methyltransferase domain-containing protein n=1 Tax=Solirubrobacter deserti TaxID=2282478 RepID=A0ABT4RKK8_9ACTN|nr:methyltransferase domain-containing protein [Solirubrobacter deserti]MBE2315787.1 methyltransferase domain-containing protein [Solirubrobacter deserti]MDA0138876.1 methyltransferase domain-containing protein [Solirubrobacter deserti]
MTDLHQGFRGPTGTPVNELTAFLQEVDRLPGIQLVRRALAAAVRPAAGERVLDAGCGIGLQTRRLADEHPDAHVTGVDHNAELLAIAGRDPRPNLAWVRADLNGLDLPESSFDVICTERVLMYLPDSALDGLVRLLVPGGRVALFELDYGATMLAPGSARDAVVMRAQAALHAALPQPWAGRRLPRLLRDRGFTDIAARPFSFTVSEPVWRGIVLGTLQDLDRELNLWLAEQADAAARGEFVAAFTGMLCTGRRARSHAPSAAR